MRLITFFCTRTVGMLANFKATQFNYFIHIFLEDISCSLSYNIKGENITKENFGKWLGKQGVIIRIIYIQKFLVFIFQQKFQ